MMWQQEVAKAVRAESIADQYCSFCNCGLKENIDFEHGESRGKERDTRPCWTRRRDKDDCCYLGPLYTNTKSSARATQCHSGLCWTAEPEQSVKQSIQASFLNVIHNPFWPQEVKCVLGYVSGCVWIFRPAMSEAQIQLRSDWMWFINHKGGNAGFNFHTSSCGFCSRWPH